MFFVKYFLANKLINNNYVFLVFKFMNDIS